VILYTINAEPAEALGIDGRLAKAWQTWQLAHTIQQVLARRRKTRVMNSRYLAFGEAEHAFSNDVERYLAFGEAEHAFSNDVELNLGCPTSDGGRTGAQKAELPGAVLHRPG
jgi:dihydroorotate dehydrogenase